VATEGGDAVGEGFGRGRESKRKAQVFHMGAGINSVPPRKYIGRPSGKLNFFGQRAHRAEHMGTLDQATPGRRKA